MEEVVVVKIVGEEVEASLIALIVRLIKEGAEVTVEEVVAVVGVAVVVIVKICCSSETLPN